MKRLKFLFPLLLLFVIAQIKAHDVLPKDYNDGPYISVSSNTITAQWIAGGQLQNKVVTGSLEFQEAGFPKINIEAEKTAFEVPKTDITTEEPIAAISDIHGQYGVFVDLLKAQKIVDDQLQWNFGKGHLVIVGDVLDRGDRVLECLWLIYNLEQQAKTVGGQVHLLLGNHELMVMNGIITYVNKKYLYTSGLLQQHYSSLFAKETFLGSWLASKNIILKINDKLFVHGGISQKAMSLNLSMDKINNLFRKNIYFKNQKEIEAVPELSTLYFDEGPLWYRGYAYPYSFKKPGIDSILKALSLNHIIVGHTTLPVIKGLYDNRIILIDSSIKWGETGQILMFDNEFKIGQLDGSQTKLISEENKKDQNTSFFEYLATKKAVQVLISEELDDIITKFNKEEAPTEGILNIVADKEQHIFNVSYNLGGKSRRKICNNPPVKIDLEKHELSNFNFNPESDKLKIVYQCGMTKTMSETVKLEKFIYDLHNVVTDFSHKTILVKTKAADHKKLLDGFLLEHRDDMGIRLGIKEIETPTIATEVLDRKEYLKMCLFQFMIANTDWSARKMHNSKLYQRLEDKAFVTIPYDFDFAGLMNNEYAQTSEKLPISKVTQRYFMDKRITREELDEGIAYFNTIQKDVMKLCKDVAYLSDNSKTRVTKFIEGFYDIINDQKKVTRMLKK